MKGKNKYIVPLLLAGVTATGVVASVPQSVTVYAEEGTENTQVVGDTVQVTGGFKDTNGVSQVSFNKGDKVYLPTVTGVDAADLEFIVTKGGKSVNVVTEGANRYFVAKYEGFYNVSIKTKTANKVVSIVDNLSVWVEREEATIKLPVNSEYVIPAKIQKGQTGLKIPAPTVVYENADGEEETKTAGELGTNFVVKLVKPNTTDSGTTLTLDATKEFYPVADDALSDAGTYQIVYEYRNGTTVVSRLESNFQVVNEYNTSKMNLSLSFLSSMPATGNVGTDITIPKVKVTESANSLDSMNSQIIIKVVNTTTGHTFDVNYNNDGKYTFHPTEEGYYAVTYKASIPLFNKSTAEVTPDKIIEIKDNLAPEVRPTYEYALNETKEVIKVNGVDIVATLDKTKAQVAEEKLVNRKVEVPSVAKLDAEGKAKVTIPAIFATDNFDTYKDLQLTRSYKEKGVVRQVEVDANKPAEITFEHSGDHEIRYKAVDRAGKTTEVVYDIHVYDKDADLSDQETKFDINVGVTTVYDKDEKIVFAQPKATNTYDKSIEVKTYYQAYQDATAKGEEVELTADDINDEGKYVINIKDIHSEANIIKIYAKATLDSILAAAPVVSDEKEVNIYRTSADTLAPTFEIVTGTWNESLFTANSSIKADENVSKIDDKGYALNASDTNITDTNGHNVAPFDQGDNELELPAVKFTDAYNNLNVTLTITDMFGNVVSKTVQETVTSNKVGSNYVYTISDAKFKLSSYGLYTITYKAEDVGGNITIKSFGVRVNDKTAPTIEINDEDKFGKTIEVGEKFLVPAGRLIKNGTEVTGGTITCILYKMSDGAKCNVTYDGNGSVIAITPTAEGTFYFRYEGTDGANTADLEANTFTITAKDTIAPELTIIEDYYMNPTADFHKDSDKEYMTVKFPTAIATDKSTKHDIEVVYTVTGPNGLKPEVITDEDHDEYKSFKVNENQEGIYTIKYYAVDAAGNEKTITKTIAIGDCEKPEMKWDNKEVDLATKVNLNEDFVLDLSKITLSDNKSTPEELEDRMTITLTAPDGSTMDNRVAVGSEYKWNMTQAGNYTLKFVIKDKAGNANTYSYSITVPEEAVDEEEMSPVLGTILVVASVVVLAGVVVYFVVSSKKKGTKTSRSKKSK